jgi:DNA-binding beta-propeller fold protein YncE
MFDKKMNILPLFTYTAENNGVALLPYWIGEAGGLLSIDTNTGKITETPIKGPMMVYGAMYSPDMKKAYANMDELYVIDLATRAITNTIVVPTGTTFAVMTSADGKKIYLQGGPTITIYNAETLKIVKTLKMSTDGMLLRRLTL